MIVSRANERGDEGERKKDEREGERGRGCLGPANTYQNVHYFFPDILVSLSVKYIITENYMTEKQVIQQQFIPLWHQSECASTKLLTS